MKSKIILASAAVIALSACTHKEEKTVIVQQPPVGSLSQHLSMVDSSGKTYGTVDLDPVGGGHVYDSSGRLIGNVVPPSHDHY